MAPQNRIWGITDIGYNSAATSNDASSLASLNEPSSGNGGSSSISNDCDMHNPLATSYCQPASVAVAASVATGNTNNYNMKSVKLCHIPNLNQAEVCASTLRRVLEEFDPIIRRRGFYLTSISEICCCGDGLDYEPRRRRKLRKQSENVWGYNTTRFLGRGRTSHSIHLRLRDPRNHQQRLLSWEDVAGTMAHELSHCVHQNHSSAFYKLMEEILEEHATLLAKKAGMNFELFNVANADGELERTSSNINNFSEALANAMPASGGHRLGGVSTGKSRLLGSGQQQQRGHRLGGSNKPPASLRETMARAAMARAAKTRGRLLDQTRRMMQRAKEPCVIEILDDDDDDDDDDDNENRPIKGYKTERVYDNLDLKPKAKRKVKRSESPQLTLPTTPQGSQKKQKAELIDLTDVANTHPLVMTPTRACAISGPDEAVSVNPVITWTCGRCTYLNRPLALMCDICLTQRG